MISNKELFMRTYKRQQNINPDIHLPSSEKVSKFNFHTKLKAKKPRRIIITSRYGDMKVDNK